MRQVGLAGLSARRAGLRKRLLRLAPVLAAGALCALPGQALAAGTEEVVTPANTAAPTLTGTAAVGQTLTCSTGTWTNSPNSFSYAWLSNGVAIPGQAGSTYVVQPGDAGKSISCQVTAGVVGGEYTITGLPSGSYKISFYPYVEGGNYLSQYFNGKATEAEATPVAVTAPNLTPNIDAALQAGGEITGVITTDTDAPIDQAEACAQATSEPYEEGCGFANEKGEYAIVGLATGSYRVEFSSYQCGESVCAEYESQYYNETDYEHATPVSVTVPSATPNINAKLKAIPLGAISGTVTAASGGKPLPGVDVCTESYPYRCVFTNANGEYTINGLPVGTAIIEFEPAPGTNYVGQYYNKVEENPDPVPVTEATITKNINAELEDGGEIAGKVTRQNGAPIANVEVCAYSPTRSFLAECVKTSEGGEYSLVGVPSGSEYTVDINAYGTPYLSKGISEVGGKEIVVLADQKTEVNVPLEEGGGISGRVTNTAGVALDNLEVCAGGTGGTSGSGCGFTNANGEYKIVGLPAGLYVVNFYGSQCNEEACVDNYLPKEFGAPVEVVKEQATPGIDGALSEGAKISGKVTSAASGALLPGVAVCAISTNEEELFFGCSNTGENGGSASAKSNAFTIPSPQSHFTLKSKKPKFDPKTGNLVFEFEFPEAGSLSWALSFKNSDVAFADDLSISNGNALAEIAKKHKGKGHKGKGKKHHKAKHCKKGMVKHKGKCVHATVLFGSGSEQVAAGKVTVDVHASKKALKALKSGHKLHVSGAFTFTSSLGGAPATIDVKAVVHQPKKHKKHKKHHKHKKGHKKKG